MIRAGLAAAFVILLFQPSGVVPARSPVRVVERQVYLMGTRARVATVATTRRDGLALLDRVVRILEATERELSTWRDSSLLSELNRQPVATPWRGPDEVCDLFDELRHWHHATGGAFDPMLGSLIEVWGLRGGGRLASPAEVQLASARAGFRRLAVRSNPCAITRLADVMVDAGAFGKGVALDRVASQLADDVWMVDLGGQIAVSGRSGLSPWPVGVADPLRRDVSALTIALELGSLAVSGGSERDRRVDGVRVGHIIDPRSGHAVARRVSVAVWHPRALVADVLSTALYVMGVGEGLRWAEARGIAAAFLVPRAGPDTASRVDVVSTTAFTERFGASLGGCQAPDSNTRAISSRLGGTSGWTAPSTSIVRPLLWGRTSPIDATGMR